MSGGGKAKEIRADVEAVQVNLSEADGAFKAAILYLFDEVTALKSKAPKKATAKKAAKKNKK